MFSREESRSISGVLYSTIIHLGPQLLTGSSNSTRRHRTRTAFRNFRPAPSYVVLLRLGFTKPQSYLCAGGLLPHRFTFATTRLPVQFGTFFSVALSPGHPGPPLAANLSYEAPTFLQCRQAAPAIVQSTPLSRDTFRVDP